MKKPKGFTLIEVLIVIGVIGILAAIAIPSYISWLPNYRLKVAARDLYSSAMKAKGEAVKRNQNCALTFNQAVGGIANVYIVYVDADADCEFDVGEIVIDRLQQWPSQVLLTGVTFTNNDDGNPTISFRSNAIPTANGGGLANGTASLSSTSGRVRNVVINQAGNVRIN